MQKPKLMNRRGIWVCGTVGGGPRDMIVTGATAEIAYFEWARLTGLVSAHPGPYSAHVSAFKRLVRSGLRGYSAVNAPIVYRDSACQISHTAEFYESVYRNCLNPLKRLKRWFTHNMDGSCK